MKNQPYVKKFDENGKEKFPESGIYSQPFKNRRQRRFEEKMFAKASEATTEEGKKRRFQTLLTDNSKVQFFGKFGHWISGVTRFHKAKIAVRQ